MIKTVFTLFIFSVSLSVFSQNSNSESYYPLEKGLSKTLTWYKSKYREVIKETDTLEGTVYTKLSQIFPPKKAINIYLRQSNDTVYYFNEVKRKETPFFGIRPIIGEEIGSGTIKKINAKLKTPKGKLTDLLVIEMNYTNGASDTRFFKKGLGLVAVKNNGKLICYYVPD